MAELQQIIYLPFTLQQLQVKSTVNSSDIIGISDANGNFMFKTTIQKLVQMSGVSFSGNIAGVAKTDTVPAAATPTNQIVYFGGPGTYNMFPGPDGQPIVLTENLNVISWDGSKSSVQAIPVSVDLSGYTESGGSVKTTKQIDDAKLEKSAIGTEDIFQGNNILDPTYILPDTIVVSTGAVGTFAGSTAIAGLPVTPGEVFTVSDYVYNSIYFYSFKNASGTVLEHGTVSNTLEMTLTAPAGAATYNQEIQHPSVTMNVPVVMINMGSTALPYEPYAGFITVANGINGDGLKAAALSEGNTTPDPAEDKNAANKKYVDNSVAESVADVIKNSDLGYTNPANLANPANRVVDSYIDSAGNTINPGPGSGWAYDYIDVSDLADGTELTISNVTITTGHSAWYNGSTKVQYATSYSTGNPGTTTKPAGAAQLRYVSMRSGVVNNEIMINVGDTALPYQPYAPKKVNAINGTPLEGSGGGGGFLTDQNTRTTDNVKFNSIEVLAMAINCPEWDGTGTPPEGLLIDDVYKYTDGSRGVVGWRTGNEA